MRCGQLSGQYRNPVLGDNRFGRQTEGSSYAVQPHLQGILSEEHRRMDDQPRTCQGIGEERRVCKTYTFQILTYNVKRTYTGYSPLLFLKLTVAFNIAIMLKLIK